MYSMESNVPNKITAVTYQVATLTDLKVTTVANQLFKGNFYINTFLIPTSKTVTIA